MYRGVTFDMYNNSMFLNTSGEFPWPPFIFGLIFMAWLFWRATHKR